ncbi:synaptogenesis protein syg-2-like isoform X2 [Limulus polyphemus]|uniref:Synaptogenesis protein syg-2-like isoform X2 n=1 Tax=Limulus polyphemus TaxID=6850 RepID=A0ABM1S7U8_LIMPO|nr:synaptogenesis protein syg-2-like isoform X2 [Limulus polyphemus]
MAGFVIYVVTVCTFIIPYNCHDMKADGDPPEKIPRIEIYAVKGRRADLPCNITPEHSDDVISLVLWYNNKSPSPLYSLDSRRGNFKQARHWRSDQLASRANFRIQSEPAYLQLDHVTSEDESVFTCRVDFEKARTRYQEIGLNLIVPPRKPIIKDHTGQVQQSLIGPYNEGDPLRLECEVTGGNPRPNVTWWRESVLLDDTFEVTADFIVRNMLRIPSLQRHDLMAAFTCEASNNGFTLPSSTSVTVNMNFRPLDVTLQGDKHSLSAGTFTQIECYSVGSRPPAVISWCKGSVPMKSAKSVVSVNGNATTSILSFKPTIEDNGLYLSCTAENPLIQGSKVESGWTLNIHYPPKLSLRLGSKLRHSHIQEGNDVYFECSVKANPMVKDITWKFEGREVQINTTAGIIISNQTLVLQHVKRTGKGRYTCSAANSEGRGASNTVFLRVQHTPACKPGQKTIYATAVNEPVFVTCEVESDPEDVVFKWRFNNSHDTRDISSLSSHKTMSTVRYVPKSKYEYGSLSCYSTNSVGNQDVPCVYSIIAAGPPEPIQNCFLTNQTQNGIAVDCTEGYDGSFTQELFVEVYDITTGSVVTNFSTTSPSFFMRGLPAGSNFELKLYAVSHQGKSEPLLLEGKTLQTPETQSRRGTEWKFPVNPILIALLSIVGVFVLIALCAVIILKTRQIRTRGEKRKPEGKVPEYTSHPDKEIISTEDLSKEIYEEKCPDVIPDSKYLEIPVCKIVNQGEGQSQKESFSAAGSSYEDSDSNFELHQMQPIEDENHQVPWKDQILLDEGISSDHHRGKYIDLQTGYRKDVAEALLTVQERNYKQTDV